MHENSVNYQTHIKRFAYWFAARRGVRALLSSIRLFVPPEICCQWRVVKSHDFNSTSSEPGKAALRNRSNFRRDELFLSRKCAKLALNSLFRLFTTNREIMSMKNEKEYLCSNGLHRSTKESFSRGAYENEPTESFWIKKLLPFLPTTTSTAPFDGSESNDRS